MTCMKLGLVLSFAASLSMGAMDSQARPAAAPLHGVWAGDQMQMVIDEHGAKLQLDCASGTVAGPLQTDSGGRFVAQGTFEPHGGGPTRADASTPARASYSGAVEDGVMKLQVLPSGASTPQVFTLRQGAKIKLHRCL